MSGLHHMFRPFGPPYRRVSLLCISLVTINQDGLIEGGIEEPDVPVYFLLHLQTSVKSQALGGCLCFETHRIITDGMGWSETDLKIPVDTVVVHNNGNICMEVELRLPNADTPRLDWSPNPTQIKRMIGRYLVAGLMQIGPT